MIEMIYLPQIEDNVPTIVEYKSKKMEQGGKIHSKVAGKYEGIKELQKKTNSFGKIRVAYINSAHKISANPSKIQKSASSIGGEFGLNTTEFYGLKLDVAVYVSQGLNFINPDNNDLNEDFFVNNLDSFAYVAKASINYNSDTFQLKVGRIDIETPYANSDDIRMAPNTFEGIWTNIEYQDNLCSQFVYLSRWAGYDSQNELAGEFQNEFKNLVNDNSFGMMSASLIYKYAKNSELSFWYNYIDKMSTIAYVEIVGIYFTKNLDLHFDYGIEMSNIQELDNSCVDGNILGAMGIIHYRGLFVGAAYNIALSDAGKYVTDGFGGGPYYTSLDEASISAISQAAQSSLIATANNNAQSYRMGIGYEFKNGSIDGLVLELVYGELYNDNGSIMEKNAILTYDITNRWYLEATYTNYESTCDNNTFDRALVRVDYKF